MTEQGQRADGKLGESLSSFWACWSPQALAARNTSMGSELVRGREGWREEGGGREREEGEERGMGGRERWLSG